MFTFRKIMGADTPRYSSQCALAISRYRDDSALTEPAAVPLFSFAIAVAAAAAPQRSHK